MIFVIGLWTFLRALFLGPAAVALENLALRPQRLVLQRSVTRPRHRILWAWLSRLWTGWRLYLIIVQPATVLAWHRQGFQLYWPWRSTANRWAGRGSTPRSAAPSDEWRRRIRHGAGGASRRNSPCSATRSPSGASPSTCTGRRLGRRPRGAPFSPRMPESSVAIDFFVVPTLTFRLLFVFVVLRHDRRELLHLNVTDHPSAVWTARQLVEALPEATAPRYLLRDRDGIYGLNFSRRVERMGIREVRIAPPCYPCDGS